MNAALCFSGGNSLDPVDAGLIAHLSKDGIARKPKDDLFQAAEVRLAGVHCFDLPAVGFCKPAVHAIEVGCKKGSLSSAGSGSNLHDGIPIFARLRRQKGNLKIFFELAETLSEAGNLGGSELRHFGVFACSQPLALLELLFSFLVSIPKLDKLLEPRMFAKDVSRPTGVIENQPAADFLLQFLETASFLVD